MATKQVERKEATDKALADKVREFLLGYQPKWWQRCPKTVKATIEDVLSLDDDLKEYIRQYLDGDDVSSSTLGMVGVSIGELITRRSLTQINAALVIQWYRENPLEAASALLQCDRVDELREPSDPDDSSAFSDNPTQKGD